MGNGSIGNGFLSGLKIALRSSLEMIALKGTREHSVKKLCDLRQPQKCLSYDDFIYKQMVFSLLL